MMLFCFQKSPADQAGPVSLPSNAGSLDPDQPSPATKISAAPAPGSGYAYNNYDPTYQPS